MKLVAIDQYGRMLFVDADKPRQSLADALGISSSSLQKIYCDGPDGQAQHIGYIGLGLWYTLHQLTEWTPSRKTRSRNTGGERQPISVGKLKYKN